MPHTTNTPPCASRPIFIYPPGLLRGHIDEALVELHRLLLCWSLPNEMASLSELLGGSVEGICHRMMPEVLLRVIMGVRGPAPEGEDFHELLMLQSKGRGVVVVHGGGSGILGVAVHVTSKQAGRRVGG